MTYSVFLPGLVPFSLKVPTKWEIRCFLDRINDARFYDLDAKEFRVVFWFDN